MKSPADRSYRKQTIRTLIQAQTAGRQIRREDSTPQRAQKRTSGTNAIEVMEYVSLFQGPNAMAEYHQEAAEWVRRVSRHDLSGKYVDFALRTALPLTATHRCQTWFRPFRAACERTTVRCFPHFSKTHSKKHPAQDSFGVIVLPAISASGLLHYHGWIRVPIAAPWNESQTFIDVHNQKVEVTAPRSLVVFLNTLAYDEDAPFFGTGIYAPSLWVNHEDGLVQWDTDEQPGRAYDYLQRTIDGELRLWASVEMIPKLVFSRLRDTMPPREQAFDYEP